MRILLTDAHSYMTLSCLRSLTRSGLSVVVAGSSRWDIALQSRYATRGFLYASPRTSVTRFLESLAAAVEKFGVDGILPISDVSLLALRGIEDIGNARVYAPEAEQLSLFLSKHRTQEIAAREGVEVPRGALIDAQDDPMEIADGSGLEFPFVLKAESTEVRVGDRIVRMPPTRYVTNPAELREEASNFIEQGGRALVQSYVAGRGYGVSGVFSKGAPLALLAHRRIREKQPSGGPSALAETIPLVPRISDPAVRLMRKVEWSGPAMVEFKGESDSEPWLMEVNGRFWGSLPLADAAGIDFPRVYCDSLGLLREESLPRDYRVGVLGRYVWGDTLSLARTILKRRTPWPGRLPGRMRATFGYLRTWFSSRVVHLDLTRDDPRPFIVRLMSFFLQGSAS